MTYQATAKTLWDAGIRDLVCVLPPTARLSTNSKISPNSRGKSPGRPSTGGTWAGYPWQTYEATVRDVVAWEQAGANIGLKAGNYPAIDIDVTREDLAATIHAEATRAFGAAPVRVGRAPKRLLMLRTTQQFPKMQLRFRADGVEHLVELLGAGQQYVVAGTHPATNAPYTLDTPVEDLASAMPHVTREAATAFFEELADTLEVLGCEVTARSFSADHAERLSVDQETLRAPSVGDVRALVAEIPNNKHDRDYYVRMGYAIKAACGAENEGEALDIWMGWAMRWEGSKQPSGETQERDFLRMHAPFEIGWHYLLKTAKDAGIGTAHLEFDASAAPPAEEEPRALGVPMWSDMAMVNRIIRAAGKTIAHVTEDGWYAWTGQRWVRKAETEVTQRVAETLATASAQALADIEKPTEATKVAMRLSSSNTVAGVRVLLKSHARIQLSPEQLDADIYLLNTPGGIIDLTTGALGPHLPERHMTKMTRVAPDFTRPAPRWRQFLREATGGDTDLEAYLQRLAGYALTGAAREEMLAFFHGSGGNGKSLFLTVLSEMMGDYATTAAMDTFTSSPYDRHPTDMAALRGARLVTASETQAGRRWDEQRIKALTGNEAVTARFMRQDSFTYRPQFTLVIAGNHAPKLEHVDDAMMRRVHLVPFTRKPTVPDTHLKDKLREELPSILAWAVEGAVAWFRVGLCPPASVLSATREYLAGEDVMLRWLAERTTSGENVACFLAAAYENFREWAKRTGESGAMATSQQQFGKALAAKGHAPLRDSLTGIASVRGFELIEQGPTEFAALESPVASPSGHP